VEAFFKKNRNTTLMELKTAKRDIVATHASKYQRLRSTHQISRQKRKSFGIRDFFIKNLLARVETTTQYSAAPAAGKFNITLKLPASTLQSVTGKS
jgi:hypothetical protein